MLLLLKRTSKSVQQRAQLRIDSVYQALKRGANFGELARKLSDDKGSAQHGGETALAAKGTNIKRV